MLASVGANKKGMICASVQTLIGREWQIL